MGTKMSVPPSSSFCIYCLSQFSLHSEKSSWAVLFPICLCRGLGLSPHLFSYTDHHLLFFCSKVMKSHTHICSKYTQINRPWQGCVSRWQRWRGHGHRAVWGEALHEVNHPDTWRRTRTVQVPPWWCGLVTTGQKTGNINCDLNLNGHAFVNDIETVSSYGT